MLELTNGLYLYHGSYCEVSQPDLGMCSKRKDFGRGFYLTTSRDQAISFLKTSMAKAVVNGSLEKNIVLKPKVIIMLQKMQILQIKMTLWELLI